MKNNGGKQTMQQRIRTAPTLVTLASTALASAALGQTDARSQVPEEELFVIGQRLEETIPQDLAQFGNRLEVLTAASTI
jgi:hypothetical protein